ncbi:hypothetical protein NG798_27765 [Ancylothrix sp. C2]|uniref:hypothetical protein n=1 Tax=Ancylothrix sp. D3o TaxID=2953691 RepID=UPI0021BAFC84|nr:hypothetical protein [Ancylothrix sp. D3o]MCT7953599.1 hypothetical protein [Ancylothrix sp. D3o]
MNEGETRGVGGHKNKTILDRSVPVFKSWDIFDRPVAVLKSSDVLDKLVPPLNCWIFLIGRCSPGKVGYF